jgi:hypothetical protein
LAKLKLLDKLPGAAVLGLRPIPPTEPASKGSVKVEHHGRWHTLH